MEFPVVLEFPKSLGFSTLIQLEPKMNHFRARKSRGADAKRQGEFARENSSDLRGGRECRGLHGGR